MDSERLARQLADYSLSEQQALSALASKVSRAFVTGAGGFLGKAICQRLIAADINVTGFARGDYPELKRMGVNMVRGDISDRKQLQQAMYGSDVVFHVASRAGVWGDKDSYFVPNVDGTRNIIDSCEALAIPRLVYTSTPSVTFSGHDESGINESAPYSTRFLNHYGRSKAVAEEMVIRANNLRLGDDKVLATVALRPHLIWGPGDPHLIPRVISRGKSGKLRLIGMRDKHVDTTYVDNAAYAHILAALDLFKSNSQAAGKAYFVSNDDPIVMREMLNKILATVSIPPVTKRIPANLAYLIGFILEGVYGVLGKSEEPLLTRFVAKQLSTDHYYDISAIKRDLGYSPIVSINEGMERLRRVESKSQ